MSKKILILLMMSVIFIMVSCSEPNEVIIDIGEFANQIDNDGAIDSVNSNNKDNLAINKIGKIYMYGELHGQKSIIEKELELWKQYYNEDGMRHLFIEWPYFIAELANLWMSGDNDVILEDIIISDFDSKLLIDFIQEIKNSCPDTIFHGTDVGHLYSSVGIKYRYYLEDNNLENTEMYILNEEAIEQGRYFHSTRDDIYRESKMVENFIREFNKLNGQSIMGIYGATHVSFEDFELGSQIIVSMGYQLSDIYGEQLQTVNLSTEN